MRFFLGSVGKLGLGSVEIGSGQRNLYTVNLNDRSLYRLPLGASRSRRRAGRAAAPTPIPNPGCVGGAERRPFAVLLPFRRPPLRRWWCSAEIRPGSGQPARRRLSRRPPGSAAPGFVEVLDFPLDYRALPHPASIASCGAPNLCPWQPWPTVESTLGRAPTSSLTGGTVAENNNPSFPQLTAITFAEDGSVILGFRDLIGDMGAINVPGEMAPEIVRAWPHVARRPVARRGEGRRDVLARAER